MKMALYCATLATCLMGGMAEANTLSLGPKKPPVMEVLSWSPRIFLFRNFLSAEECFYFIAMAQPHLHHSYVIGSEHSMVDDQVRTSASMFFPIGYTDPILKDVEDRISLITLMPPENGESMQVVHYKTGQQYKPHYDYFDCSTYAGQVEYSRGGQRMVSFLMYLNTPDEGGETVFPLAEVAVKPQKGDAVLFFDCDLYGREDPLTLHGGAPVVKGEKWLATKWLHPRTFGTPAPEEEDEEEEEESEELVEREEVEAE